MKHLAAFLLLALALAGCGGPNPETALIGKWAYQQLGKIQDATFTPDGVRYVEGLPTFSCWAIRDGKLVLYGRAVTADAETAATWTMAWNGNDEVTISAGENSIKMLRTSSDGTLSAEGKRTVVEKTLSSDAGGCED